MFVKIFIASFLMLMSLTCWAQYTPIDPSTATPTTPNWEVGFKSRVNDFLNAKTWSTNIAVGGPDNGKKAYPELFAEIAKNPVNTASLLSGSGVNYINSDFIGSFCSPFSASGHVYYYFNFKNILPASQKTTIRNRLLGTNFNGSYRCPAGKTGFHFLMRPDGQIDPIYNAENPGNPNNLGTDPVALGAEKNSENYMWMLRMAGYLYAEEFITNTDTLNYFRDFVKNWVRALYNSGQIEWSSNNYFGHQVPAVLGLHDHAPMPAYQKMAKAGLDRMFLDLALKHLDGQQMGPDVRSKTNGYKPFSGSAWGWSYLMFADANHMPTYGQSGAIANASYEYVGYPSLTLYRPPQVVVDIAQRNFTLPIEVIATRPSYKLADSNYAAWRGDQLEKGRWEYETIWLDSNAYMGSLATNVPDGWFECDKQRPFWEQSLLRIASKGTHNGAVQIIGNSGINAALKPLNYSTIRNPFEQIAQHRNIMMRTVHNTAGTDSVWFAVPKNLTVTYHGDTAFVEMPNEVYVAFVPYGHSGFQVCQYSADKNNYNRLAWGCPQNTTTALVAVLGTAREYSSISHFISSVRGFGGFSQLATGQIEFATTGGTSLQVEHQPTVLYTYRTPFFTSIKCEIDHAGTTPKAWGSGHYIDYQNWPALGVTYGQQIVGLKWGSGDLYMQSNNNGLRITVNHSDANVTYQTFAPTDTLPVLSTTPFEITQPIASDFTLFPNPAKNYITFLAKRNLGQNLTIRLLDVTGKRIANLTENQPTGHKNLKLTLHLPKVSAGFYFVEVKTNIFQKVKQLVIHP